MIRALALALLMAAAGCATTISAPIMDAAPERTKPKPVVPKLTKADEIAFARATLEAIQHASVKQNIEYCGYIGLDRDRRFWASSPAPGEEASCLSKEPPNHITLLASYHTHAGYSPYYDSEVPSTTDVYGDIEYEIDGYISTPGGRFWFVDSSEELAYQICGERCLYTDPRYRRETEYEVLEQYTLKDLEKAGF